MRRDRETKDRPGRRLGGMACALMVLAAVGLVVAMLLGAPLVSVLFVGLLLLCPLLMWVPFRSGDAGVGVRPGRGEASR